MGAGQEPRVWGGAAAGFSPQAFVQDHYLFRCPQQLADFEDGVNFTGPGEEWPEGVHFRHDAAHGPDVNGGAVAGRPQEHFRSPVPGGPKMHCRLVRLQFNEILPSIRRERSSLFLIAI